MTTEKSLIDSALRGWKSNLERADKLFAGMSPEQLEQEVAPGKNRLIYLWGHLAAVNDALLPLLGIGERLHPELDGMFISNPDKSAPLTVSGESRRRKRISNGSRIGIDSRFCSEEPRTLPITWGRRHWRGRRRS
jgi:hypothetical protein